MSSDNVIYFDNSATSWPKPRETGEAMMYYLNDVGANPGRSGHSRSVEAGQIVLNARENLCRLFNVKLPQQIAFTKNITESLNCVFYTMLKGGDHVTVNSVGSVLRNYTVEGSLESELLQKFYKRYAEGVMDMNDIVARFTASDVSEAERDTLTRRYTELYRDIKRDQLRFIVENKDKIAAVYALYQRLPGDAYLFNGDSDLIYYRTVAEGIEQTYPESPYLPILRSQVSRMDAQLSLLSQVKLTDFPEINMPDMYGNDVKLSSLEGKVILLHFWSAALGNGNAVNADLKTIYEKYHDLGFEIYQVAVDTSKAVWINAIQEQQLPWISVSDLQGNASPALSVYNVKKLPSNYLIDREGNIVGKDLVGERLDEAVRQYIGK